MKSCGLLVFLVALASCGPRPTEEVPTMAKTTEEEWRRRLTPDQYRICRLKGTEAPGSGKYLEHKEVGTYSCVACGKPLFSSETKYDSGCGWPAFWDALPQAITVQSGDGESLCSQCGSHLGHLFDDGPPPTGKRY